MVGTTVVLVIMVVRMALRLVVTIGIKQFTHKATGSPADQGADKQQNDSDEAETTPARFVIRRHRQQWNSSLQIKNTIHESPQQDSQRHHDNGKQNGNTSTMQTSQDTDGGDIRCRPREEKCESRPR